MTLSRETSSSIELLVPQHKKVFQYLCTLARLFTASDGLPAQSLIPYSLSTLMLDFQFELSSTADPDSSALLYKTLIDLRPDIDRLGQKPTEAPEGVPAGTPTPFTYDESYPSDLNTPEYANSRLQLTKINMLVKLMPWLTDPANKEPAKTVINHITSADQSSPLLSMQEITRINTKLSAGFIADTQRMIAFGQGQEKGGHLDLIATHEYSLPSLDVVNPAHEVLAYLLNQGHEAQSALEATTTMYDWFNPAILPESAIIPQGKDPISSLLNNLASIETAPVEFTKPNGDLICTKDEAVQYTKLAITKLSRYLQKLSPLIPGASTPEVAWNQLEQCNTLFGQQIFKLIEKNNGTYVLSVPWLHTQNPSLPITKIPERTLGPILSTDQAPPKPGDPNVSQTWELRHKLKENELQIMANESEEDGEKVMELIWANQPTNIPGIAYTYHVTLPINRNSNIPVTRKLDLQLSLSMIIEHNSPI